MFGDYFGQRADYSQGMFYAGHRRFLNPEGMSSVEPPIEYKSKRQIREMKMSRGGTGNSRRSDEKISFQMNFPKKGQDHSHHHHHHSEGGENNNHNNNNSSDPTGKKFRKVANLIRSTITLDHFSSAEKEDWMEQKRAGVKIWVNKETGEVASECPWDTVAQTPIQRLLKSKSKRRMSDGSFGSQLQEVQLGTGSLVYDGAEVQELFKILDGAK